MAYFSGWKKIKNISIGIVYIFFISWVMFHTTQYFPAGQQEQWLKVVIMYGLLNAMAFGVPDIRNKLFSWRLIKFVPRMAFFFVLGLLFFYMVLRVYGDFGNSGLSMLLQVPLWLALTHALIFSLTETAIWQGYLDNKLGHPWSELSAGLFHYGIWSGGVLMVMFSAGSLFFIFSFANYKLRKNKTDLSPAAGIHTAWNVLKLVSFMR